MRRTRQPITDRDRREVDAFAQLLEIEGARKNGAPDFMCDSLLGALYPGGVGGGEEPNPTRTGTLDRIVGAEEKGGDP